MTASVSELIARIERGVLGASLRDETARRIVLGSLSSSDYADLSHGAVHDALVRLTSARESVDWESVLRVGDRRLLARLTGADLLHAGRALDAAKAASWAQHVRSTSAARSARRAIDEAIAWQDSPASAMSPEGFFERVGRAISDAQRKVTRQQASDAPALVDELGAYLSSETARGVPCGIAALDAMLGGLAGSSLYVIGGRSSVGKTALACTIARAACEYERTKRALVFSLEMPRRELVARWVAGLSGINSRSILDKSVDVNATAFVEAIARFDRWPLSVDASERLTIGELCARATVAHATRPLSLILVDYVQLVRPNPGKALASREREVAEISGELKALAKALDVPVVALAQLNRDSEKRDDKRPRLADLRESDAIVHDADAVALLYREWLYDKSASPESAEIIVAKNRAGECGTVRARYLAPLCMFADEDGGRPSFEVYEGGQEEAY